MTLLDSNVVIRIITGDSPKIAHELLNIIESSGKNEFYMHSPVFVEVCFVLEFHDYQMTRDDIYSALKRLVTAPQIICSKTSLTALNLYKKYSYLDFTDCYLLALKEEKDQSILTLNKDLQKLV